MALNELIYTLNLRDDKYHIILEMLITIEATNRSIIEFLMHEASGGDEQLAKVFFESFQNSQSKQRELIIQGLYESFGNIPDGLLSGDHE